MQRITIKQVLTKPSPPDAKKPYTLVIVQSEDGAELTSFDTALTSLGPGSVIEFEPDVVVKGGKTKVNIKEFKIISETPAASVAPTPTTPGNVHPETYAMEEEGRRYRQQVDRLSAERQTAFNGIITLASTPGLKLSPESASIFNDALTVALGWAIDALTESGTKTVPEPPHETTAKSKSESAFKNGIELVNYALKQGLKLDDIKTTLSISNPGEIKDVAGAAAILFPKK
jgi:hypothetical protein